MKSSLNIRPLVGTILSLFVFTDAHAQVTVDGIRNGGESYNLLANQTIVSNWNEAGISNNEHEALANIHAVQDGTDLAIHIAARVKNRGILLFIDSRDGGRSFIPNPLINFGGEGQYINNLGTSPSSGMTFESGFEADYAIRIFGNGEDGAFVNLYDLNAGARTYVGNAGPEVVSSSFIKAIKASGLGSNAIAANVTDYAAATQGVEMKLDLAALGVPSGAQTVKLMALLMNQDSNYASNQMLASRTFTDDIGGGITAFSFQTEPGTQTLSVAVNGPASRKVVFNVEMNQEISKGFFTAATDKVKVLFFSGAASGIPGEIFLTDDDNNGIYTGSLMATGAESESFGNYKFFNTAGNPNSGFEYGADRTFVLGALEVDQPLSTVTFRANSFTIWSGTFSLGQTATEDKDGDGLDNIIEYFMGSNNSAFTPTPSPVDGVITWPRDPFATGVSFKVWKSTTLAADSWEIVPEEELDLSSPNSVKYTLPEATKLFVRLGLTED